MLLVIALLGVVAGLFLPRFQPAVGDQLVSTARTIASDVLYCRDLAVGNSSRYRLTFDLPNNRYYLEHSGANPSLDQLPSHPLVTSGSTATRQMFDLDEFPRFGPAVRIVAVQTIGAVPQAVTTLEIGPLGESTSPDPTRVWIACGSGDDQLYTHLQVDPITGLVQQGKLQTTGP